MDSNGNSGTWRIELPAGTRQKIMRRIADTLSGHVPSAGQESQSALLNIASHFEMQAFNAASDTQDYLRRISLKMLKVETKNVAARAQATAAG